MARPLVRRNPSGFLVRCARSRSRWITITPDRDALHLSERAHQVKARHVIDRRGSPRRLVTPRREPVDRNHVGALQSETWKPTGRGTDDAETGGYGSVGAAGAPRGDGRGVSTRDAHDRARGQVAQLSVLAAPAHESVEDR